MKKSYVKIEVLISQFFSDVICASGNSNADDDNLGNDPFSL